jgi:hypothetical protein
METYGGVEVQLHAFLTSAIDGGGQRHALAALPPGKRPRYPLEKRLGGPQSLPGRYGEQKNLVNCRETHPNSSAVQ